MPSQMKVLAADAQEDSSSVQAVEEAMPDQENATTIDENQIDNTMQDDQDIAVLADNYPATGKIARVANTFSNFCCGISKVFYGEVENLPEPKRGTMYIVSAMVLSAENAKPKSYRRKDLIAPATGHPDCIRKDGFIVSVPGFVR